MVKKSRISIDDDYDFNQELDIPDFDFGDGNVKDDRKPATKVISSIPKGMVTGIKETAFLKKTAKTLLPEGFGETMDLGDSIKESVKRAYDDAVKEIKPGIKEFKRIAPKLVSSDSKILPKAVADRFKKWEEDNKPQSKTPSVDDLRESSITSALGSIFKIQAEDQYKRSNEEDAKDRLREGIELSRHKDSYSMSNKQAMSLSRIEQYYYNVDLAHKKKSLELQFRNLFALRDIYTHMREDSAKRNEILGNVVKNTGLPDAIKITGHENFRDISKKKFNESLSNGLFGTRNNFVENISKRFDDVVMSKVKDYASGAVGGMQQLESGKEMADGLGDMGGSIDKHKMAGNMAGSMGTQAIIGHLASKYRDKLLNTKTAKKFNLDKKGYSLQHHIGNASGYLNEFKNKDYSFTGGAKGTILPFLQELIPGLGIDRQASISKGADLYAPASINKKTLNSINDIIPGYLARILRELMVTRTGNTKIELTKFDHENGKFTSADKLTGNIFNSVISKSGVVATNNKLDDIIENIESKTGVMDEATKKAMKSILIKNKSHGGSSTMASLGHSRLYKGINSKTSMGVKDRLGKFTNSLSEQEKHNFTIKHNSLNDYIDDTRNIIQQHLEHGNLPELKRLGLINQGGVIDIDKILEYYSSGYKDKFKRKSTRECFDLLVKYGVITKSKFNLGKGKEKFTLRNLTQDDYDKIAKKFYKSDTRTAKVDIKTFIDTLKDKNIISRDNIVNVDMLSSETKASHTTSSTTTSKLVSNVSNIKPIDTDSLDSSSGISNNNVKSLLQEEVQIADLYVAGDPNPRITASKLKAGKYRDKTTNVVITSLNEIQGAVIDEDNNTVIEQEELKLLKYYNIKTGIIERYKSAKLAAAGAINKAKPTISHLGNSFSKMVATGITRAINYSNMTVNDVYVKGDPTPRLTAIKIRASKYRLKDTGQIVTNVKMINGDVIDENNNIVLEASDLDKLIVYEPLSKKFLPIVTGLKVLNAAWHYQTKIAPAMVMWNFKQVGKVLKFGSDIVRGRLIAKDVYVGNEKTPRLYGTKLKAGNYRLRSNNKVITHHDDVVDAVIDEHGNVVIEYEELNDIRVYRNILNWFNPFKLAKTVVKGAKDFTVWGAKKLMNTGLNISKFATRGISKVLTTGIKLLTKPCDVYVKDLPKPVLYKELLVSGSYYSVKTGKVITHHKDVDGAVIDIDGNIVLTEEQFESGLYNVTGKRIFGHLGKKIFAGLSKINKLFSIRTKLNNVKGLPKNINDANKVGLTKTELIGSKSLGVLENINDLLNKTLKKKKIEGDADGDGTRDNSYLAKLRGKKAKDKATIQKPTGVVKEESFLSKLLDWLKNPLVLAGLAGTLAFVFRKELMDFLEDKLGHIWKEFLDVPANIKAAFTPSIAKFAGTVDDFIKGTVSFGEKSLTMVESFGSKAMTMVDDFGKKSVSLLDDLVGWGKNLTTNIAETIGKAFPDLTKGISSVWESTVTKMSSAFSWLGEGVGSFVNMIKNSPIAKMVGNVGGWVSNAWGGAKSLVTSAAESAVGKTALGFVKTGLRSTLKLAKSVPGLNAVVYAYSGYKDWTAATEAYERGEITEEELTSLHKRAVAANIGGAAGASLGTVGGAFVGSAAGPVGTFIGGAAGGAAGGLLGENLGGRLVGANESLEEILKRKKDGIPKDTKSAVIPSQKSDSGSGIHNTPNPVVSDSGNNSYSSVTGAKTVKTNYSQPTSQPARQSNVVSDYNTNSGYARSTSNSGINTAQSVNPIKKSGYGNTSNYVPVSASVNNTIASKSLIDNSSIHNVYNQGTSVKSNKGVVKASASGMTKVAKMSRISAIDAVRLKAYGITKLEELKVKSIFHLEGKLVNDVTYDSDNTAHWEGDPSKVLNDCMGYFGVTNVDGDEGTQWTGWFNNRFLPVFTKYMSSIMSITGKRNVINISNTMKVKNQFELASTIAALNIWSDTNSPWPEYSINTDSTTIKENINFLDGATKQQEISDQRSATKTAQPNARNNTSTYKDSNSGRNNTNKNGNNTSSVGADGSQVDMSKGDTLITNDLTQIRTRSGKSALVRRDYASNFQGFINELESTGYHIDSLAGFADRTVKTPGGKDTGKKSMHSYGAAIDINPPKNPFLKDKLVTDLPSNITEMAHKYGIGWGGDWKSSKDPMHFSMASSEGGSVNVKKGGTVVANNTAASVMSASSNVNSSSIMGGKAYKASYVSGGNNTSSTPTMSFTRQPSATKPASIFSAVKPSSTTGGSSYTGSGYMSKTMSIMGMNGSKPSVPANSSPAPTPTQVGSSGKYSSSPDKLNAGNYTSRGSGAWNKGGSPEINRIIDQVADEFKIDRSIMHGCALVESGKNPNAKTPSGTYRGLYQFGPPAWKTYGGGASWDQVFDPLLNARAFARYATANAKILRSHNIPVNPVNIYLAHQQGPGGIVQLYSEAFQGGKASDKVRSTWKGNWPKEAGPYTGKATDFYNGWVKRLNNKMGGDVSTQDLAGGSSDGSGGSAEGGSGDAGLYFLSALLGVGKPKEPQGPVNTDSTGLDTTTDLKTAKGKKHKKGAKGTKNSSTVPVGSSNVSSIPVINKAGIKEVIPVTAPVKNTKNTKGTKGNVSNTKGNSNSIKSSKITTTVPDGKLPEHIDNQVKAVNAGMSSEYNNRNVSYTQISKSISNDGKPNNIAKSIAIDKIVNNNSGYMKHQTPVLPTQVYDPITTNRQKVSDKIIQTNQDNYSPMTKTDSLLSESVQVEKQMLEVLISLHKSITSKGIKLHQDSIDKVNSNNNTDDDKKSNTKPIKDTPKETSKGPEFATYETPKAMVSMKRHIV